MHLESIEKIPFSGRVFEQLQGQILSKRTAAGASLPPERKLAEQLGVNRGAVREAIKRLEQAHLVEVRQGGGTRICDWEETAGLEVLPSLLLLTGSSVNKQAVRGVLALRQELAPAIAAAAAAHADPDQIDKLDSIVSELAQAQTPEARQQLAMTFWRCVVQSSDNIGFVLAFNSMARTYRAIWSTLTGVMAEEFADVEGLVAITTAIRAGDAETARAAAARHVAIGKNALSAALGLQPPSNGDSK